MDPSTTSLWDSNNASNFPTLNEDLATEVVVIGAGITGLTAALRLAEAGRRVVVLEARTVGSGVTGYTTAHLTEDVDAGYAALRSTFGPQAAKTVAQSLRAAIDHVGARVAELRIDCDFTYVPAYYFTEEPSRCDELTVELDACMQAGLQVSRCADGAPLPWRTASAFAYHDQARVHPLKYLRGLMDECVRRGVRVYEYARVVGIEEGEPCEVALENGTYVTADAVFSATHVPLNRLALQTKLGHYQSYVIAYRHNFVPDALFYDDENPYHYIRSATIDGERFLIIGGADHKTGEGGDTREAYERVIQYANQRLGLGEPAMRWSAEVHESIDGLPLIGRNSGSRRIYVATGFGGDGMTFGTVAGLLVSDLILGHENAWQKLYDATRVTPSAFGEFLRENLSVPKHLIGDRLRRSEADSIGDIERGDGKIMRVDGQRLAVYRDPAGALHAVSAVCTHMGCIVHFNRAEKTWDCPCHGSRFGTDGSVIEGPAMRELPASPVEDQPAVAKQKAG